MSIEKPGSTEPTVPDDRVNILEVVLTLSRYKGLLIGLPLVACLIVTVISFGIANRYTATAKLLPPQQSGPAVTALLMGDPISLGAGNSIGQALGLKNSSDLYLGMLKSRSVADALIKRFDLTSVYGTDGQVQTRERLHDATSLSSGRDGIITIQVEDKDPKRAADLANAYVEELDRLTQRVSVTAAGRQRVFMERQLAEVKTKLADAELALQATQAKTGLINVNEQGRALIESIASMRALVAAKQVQLAAMATSNTEKNPEFVRMQQELVGLRAELHKLEKGSASEINKTIPSASGIPYAGLEYVRKYRDVQYYQSLFDLLAKQFEIARAQESAEGGLIQVLDAAVPPDRRSSPKRLLLVLITAAISILVGLLACYALEVQRRVKASPRQSLLLDELSQNLRSWRSRAR